MSSSTQKRFARGTVVAAAAVGALALSLPATASAATANAPQLTADLSGSDLTMTLRDTNNGLLDGCAGGLVDAGRAVEISDKLANLTSLSTLIDVLRSGVIKGTPLITTALGRTAQETVYDLPTGVYAVVAACAGVGKDTAIAIEPVIAPSGVGSVTGVVDLGSTVLENPDSIPFFLALLGGDAALGGSSSGGSSGDSGSGDGSSDGGSSGS
ncbi:hypothetical protein [Rhodococcus triatomae]